MKDHELERHDIDPRIQAAADEGCEESQLYISRRAVMGMSAGLFTWAFLPRSASATSTGLDEKRLLVVLLQGGLDGLHLAPPIGDPLYATTRRTLALDPANLNALDGFFHLNKSMPEFHKAYLNGQAAVIHSIAPPLRVRSHFECMYNLESGYPGQLVRSAKSGWLNRVIATLPRGNAVMSKGLQMGSAPLIFTGKEPVLSWTPGGWPMPNWHTRAQSFYDKADPELAALLARGVGTRAMAIARATNDTVVNEAFYGAGRLLAAPGGPRIAALQIVGWDSHVSQAAGLSSKLASLDASLTEFRTAMGEAAWSQTVVVCVSEFGRTAWDNGRNGTDHGTGTAALLMGGAVNGGKVITDWPGLKQLRDGRDLRATVCTRKLFKGILQDHLGISRSLLDTEIFPDSADVRPMEGLIRTASSQRRRASSAPVSAASRPNPDASPDQMLMAE